LIKGLPSAGGAECDLLSLLPSLAPLNPPLLLPEYVENRLACMLDAPCCEVCTDPLPSSLLPPVFLPLFSRVVLVVLFLMLLSSAVVERCMPGLRLVFDLTMMWVAAAREVLETPMPVPVSVPVSVPLGLSRARRMDSRCPCEPLVIMQASLPRASARGHKQSTSRAEDRGENQSVYRTGARNVCGPTCSLLDGAQAGKQDARSGDLRKCIAERHQECCPRKPLHAQSEQ
jgi:hypothetical protein